MRALFTKKFGERVNSKKIYIFRHGVYQTKESVALEVIVVLVTVIESL